MREATLSVLDIFGQPVDEDEPMLMPIGYDSSSASPASPQIGSGSSSEERGGRSEIPGGGTLVHQYLKQNSQVCNMNYQTFCDSFDQ